MTLEIVPLFPNVTDFIRVSVITYRHLAVSLCRFDLCRIYTGKSFRMRNIRDLACVLRQDKASRFHVVHECYTYLANGTSKANVS